MVGMSSWQDLARGREYGDRLVKISFLCGITATVLMLLITPVLLACVKLTPEARKYLTGMLLVIAVYMIGRAVNDVTINGIFAAGGDTLFDLYSLAVCMWCLAIPLAAAGTFFFHWPVVVVYACTCLDEVGKIPWVMYHYKRYKWVKDLPEKWPEKNNNLRINVVECTGIVRQIDKAIKSHRNREKTKNKLNFLPYFGKIQVDYRKMPMIRLLLYRNFFTSWMEMARKINAARRRGHGRSTECQTRK